MPSLYGTGLQEAELQSQGQPTQEKRGSFLLSGTGHLSLPLAALPFGGPTNVQVLLTTDEHQPPANTSHQPEDPRRNIQPIS